jgi:Glycosyl hydrolase family 26
MRIRRYEWHRSVAALLLAGAAGALACVAFFPGTDAVPAADRITPAGASASAALHGQSGGGSRTQPGVAAHASSSAPRHGSASYSVPPHRPDSFPAPPRGSASSSAPPSGSVPGPTATGAGQTPAATATPETTQSISSTATASPAPSLGSFSFPSVPPVGSDQSTAPPAGSGTSPVAPPAGSGTSPAAPPAGSTAPLSNAAGLGLYDGQSSPAGIETAAAWLGSPSDIKYAEDFIDATDWSHISDPWQLPNWAGSPYTMIWGVPMVPCGAPSTQCATNVADYNEVADGGADSYYQALAQNLVNAGFGSSYIRLGWEFNADWMGWGVCNADGSGLASWASDFVPAFQNIVTSMRSVSGANFKFIWNPIDSSNSSCAGAALENFYPGDNYVDVVALDVYDGLGAATTDNARWTDMLDGVNTGGWTAMTPGTIGGQSFPGYGLNWLAAFGAEHGKEVGLPEWGLDDASTNGGGGDDTYFMTQMTDWIKANATGPVIYWNYGGGTLPLDIPNYTNGNTPNATAIFQAAFSAGI